MYISYKELTKIGKCIDYEMRYAGNSQLWVETWHVNNVDYYAVFSDVPNATLPTTITTHDFLSRTPNYS
jgi:hypothetical protein